ncbi:MAG TPA: DUF4062 domain-containing protein [Anaerolineae bacterium]|nr:DUF4062 domain-containing protein [Anaerolineae bacterium]
MTHASRTFRIFVSSTFSDLAEERNALQARVFPRLRTLAEAHGCRFQVIDLRWGVSEEASLDQQTMKICLGEIERCQKISPRPNFVILLGNRYGWRPLPAEIPADEFQALVEATTVQDRPLLEEWYRLDENALPAHFCLLPRTADHIAFELWEPVEQRLHAILEKAAHDIGLPPSAQFKYTASATEQEIQAGALGIPDAKNHVYCYFRELRNLPADPCAASYVDLDKHGHPDSQASHQLQALRERLKATLPENTRTYEADWLGQGSSLDHLERLGQDVYQDLEQVILREIALLGDEDPLDREIASHTRFGRDRAGQFVGREQPLQAIAGYLQSSSHDPLVVWGESGCGKSALMARAIAVAQGAHPHSEIISRFVGATPESTSARALLESLCRQFARLRDAETEASVPAEYEQLVEQFPLYLEAATTSYARPEAPKDTPRRFREQVQRAQLAEHRRSVFVFIDALDQVGDAGTPDNLAWLPERLPREVKLVVSALPGQCLEILRGKVPPENVIHLSSMSVAEGDLLLSHWLAETQRSLQAHQKEHVLASFTRSGLPLYLKLALDEARRWKSYDPLPDLKADIPGMIRQLFERLARESNHGKILVERALGYLAAARNGLSEDEILDLLSRDPDVVSDFLARSPRSPRVNRLPVVVWSRLFFDLEAYLYMRRADGASLLSFYHRQLEEIACSDYLAQDRQSPGRHAALASFFGEQPLYLEGAGSQAPNLRKLSEQAYQQAQAGLGDALIHTLTDFSYVSEYALHLGHQALLERLHDLELPALQTDQQVQASRQGFTLIQEAIRLSAPALTRHRDQLPAQLHGRLKDLALPEITALLSGAEHHPRPWLRPLRASLNAPGQALVRVFDHSEPPARVTLTACALTPDERRLLTVAEHLLVEGSGYHEVSHALTLWDLDSGRQLWSLGNLKWEDEVVVMTMGTGGQRAYLVDQTNQIQVWDLEKRKMLHPLERERLPGSSDSRADRISVLRTHPDGSRLVAGMDDGSIVIWNTRTGRVLRRQEGHSTPVTELIFDPDGRHFVSLSRRIDGVVRSGIDSFATTSRKGSAIAWNLADEDEYLEFELEEPVLASALTSDGKRLLTVTPDGWLEAWNIRTGRKLPRPRILVGKARYLKCLAGGDYAATISKGELQDQLTLWDLNKGIQHSSLAGAYPDDVADIHQRLVFGQQRLLVASTDWSSSAARLWSLERPGVYGASPNSHAGRVLQAAISPGGRKMATTAEDKTIKIWELNDGQVTEAQSLCGHTHLITALAFTADGRQLISASLDRTLKLWDPVQGREVNTLTGITTAPYLLQVTPQNRVILVSTEDVRVWTINPLAQPYAAASQSGYGSAVASPDGHSCAVGHDGRVRVHPLDKEGFNRTFDAAEWPAAFSPDGRYLAARVTDDQCPRGTLRIWDLKSGKVRHNVGSEIRPLRQLLFTPGGEMLVALDEWSLQVWDITSGLVAQELVGIELRHIHLVGEGRLIIGHNGDSDLFAWDIQSGEMLASFTCDGRITCLHGVPHEHLIVVGDDQGMVHLLRLDGHAAHQPAPAGVQRPVQEAEKTGVQARRRKPFWRSILRERS